VIDIKNLKITFGNQRVLDGISLQIPDNETFAIVGPSGTGKSVLLKIIVGLLTPDSGEVIVNGESMTKAKNAAERRKICSQMGVLFQNAALIDSMNLYENVAFPLRERRQHTEKEIRKEVLRRFEEVGLEGCLTSLPGEVSIGMRKRTGIARALVTNPSIILFDEPNTGLDPQVGQEIYELITETQKKAGFTGIVISHEIPEVFQVCQQVAMLYQGKVQTVGTIEEFLSSHNPVVQQFIRGDVNGPIQMS
jgi:phospholipid/cholesterol/gamma-HCH transport system ATP-binding protein